jgi:hypothetical protein
MRARHKDNLAKAAKRQRVERSCIFFYLPVFLIFCVCLHLDPSQRKQRRITEKRRGCKSACVAGVVIRLARCGQHMAGISFLDMIMRYFIKNRSYTIT